MIITLILQGNNVTHKVLLFTKIKQEQRREDSKKILLIPYLKHTTKQTNMNHSTKRK